MLYIVAAGNTTAFNGISKFFLSHPPRTGVRLENFPRQIDRTDWKWWVKGLITRTLFFFFFNAFDDALSSSSRILLAIRVWINYFYFAFIYWRFRVLKRLFSITIDLYLWGRGLYCFRPVDTKIKLFPVIDFRRLLKFDICMDNKRIERNKYWKWQFPGGLDYEFFSEFYPNHSSRRARIMVRVCKFVRR